ncbi:precorrin-6y C5,15-methyltransferase (decarboxylating) subunit CbiE [Marinagarivorans algicola]|uniref:precorrin-6y C5,15-methyltransferase (decarboxylating) subunit CbiE n=1 Tax=Marinagarivorans algicola TaxID=1513270 RepID=UPI0009E76025|nr:precorrin-6y C5,15-methyltransferase (decarboxylating) subunit CbiE [Marinagarivorans algicola]
MRYYAVIWVNIINISHTVSSHYGADENTSINITIHIIGLGVAQTAVLNTTAIQALRTANTVIGAARQLATVGHVINDKKPRCIELPRLCELTALIESLAGNVVVLASGDPLYYGIGRWFTQRFAAVQLRFYPAVSSVQAACHRLGLALQDVEVLSLHGRPVEKLRTKLKANKHLLILTDKNSHPQRLAQECLAANYPDTQISICENLGYNDIGCNDIDNNDLTNKETSSKKTSSQNQAPDNIQCKQERVSTWPAQALANSTQVFSDLHVTHLHVRGHGGVLPEFPGIPDHHFQTGAAPGKGMISKREVRLAILSMMGVCAQDVVWDIGAGCGGVAIELALWNEQANIYAIECHTQRLAFLRQNQQHFGVVQNLHVIAGRAPAVLVNLPAPNKVFIGGSDGELEALLHSAWAVLPDHGVLVASGVIERTKHILQRFADDILNAQINSAPVKSPKSSVASQVESIELGVKRGEKVDGRMQYVAKLPIEIFKFTKKTGER